MGRLALLPLILILLPVLPVLAGNGYTLVDNGQPTSALIVGAHPTRAAYFAATELQEHFRKITGAEVPIVREGQAVNGVKIYVGESEATRKLGLRSADFKSQEYALRFRPDAILLLGRDQENAGLLTQVKGKPGWGAGKFGGALSLDGAADRVVLPSAGFPDAEGTVECWVNMPLAAEGLGGPLWRLDGDNPWSYHFIQIEPGTSKLSYRTYDGKQGYTVVSRALTPGWHFVSATHSAAANKMELFVDGVSQGTAGYTPTACVRAGLVVGGPLSSKDKPLPVEATTWMIDDLRVSATVRPGGTIPEQALAYDDDALLLASFDEGEGAPRYAAAAVAPGNPPGWNDEQGTLYAAYHFLERCCDVRWYAPTDLGTVLPHTRTLTVQGEDVRRAPAFRWKQTYPHTGNMDGSGITNALWNHPTTAEQTAFWRRMRWGGERYGASHSFYGMYDRFWAQNPKNPEAWEGAHPEYFAKGYTGVPPQMCYTDPGFLKQIVADANAYFDAPGSTDYFPLVPMDNSQWCKCEACQALILHTERTNYSSDIASNYFFAFANRVAKEVAKTHPDKYIATLAYSTYAYPPNFPLEPNISVQFCLHVRNWWSPKMRDNDLKLYRKWLKEQPGRPFYLWLYYCFPDLASSSGGFHSFPGFFAHTAAEQFKMFAKDGVRGAFFDGIGAQVDTYVAFQMLDDPSQDVDEMLNEFYDRYYGPAGPAMKAIYTLIEDTYMNPQNYPPDIRDGKVESHQTEEIAWGWLGTPERMKQLGDLMAEAEVAARTTEQRERVALFREGVYDYMVAGAERYQRRKAAEPQREALKTAPLPVVKVPAVAAVPGGDPAKVDWGKAVALPPWYTAQGYPTTAPIASRAAHDGTYLYLEFEQSIAAATLAKGNLWGEDFELFFAAARSHPINQLAFNPWGQMEAYSYAAPGAGSLTWVSEAKVVNDPSGDHWLARVSIPLANLIPGGVKPGGKFYANFYRMTSKGDGAMAWSPNFEVNFHRTDRMGEFVLE